MCLRKKKSMFYEENEVTYQALLSRVSIILFIIPACLESFLNESHHHSRIEDLVIRKIPVM
jgi:hypothetical protein